MNWFTIIRFLLFLIKISVNNSKNPETWISIHKLFFFLLLGSHKIKIHSRIIITVFLCSCKPKEVTQRERESGPLIPGQRPWWDSRCICAPYKDVGVRRDQRGVDKGSGRIPAQGQRTPGLVGCNTGAHLPGSKGADLFYNST